MTKKEILVDMLKKYLGERLTKLEKYNNEEESSLKSMSETCKDLTKKLAEGIKSIEQKAAKEKMEEQKKLAAKQAEEAKKQNKKKEVINKTTKKPNANNIKKTNDKLTDKKNTIPKTKSISNLKTQKPIAGKSRGKSQSRINTEGKEVTRNTMGITTNLKREFPNKKNDPFPQAPKRNTIGGNKKTLKISKSMGKLSNKPTLKKANDEKKKKGIEDMQQMVNNIKIQEKLEEVKPKIEILPPTFMSCHKLGILDKYIIQFLSKKEQITLFSCNKVLAPLGLSILKDQLSLYKTICDVFIGQTMDDKIKSLDDKYTNEELNAPIKKFELSRGCAKAIGLMDEELYMKPFIRPAPEKTLEEINIVYKIFCQLLNKEDFVEIKDDKVFWDKFSKFVLDNKGDKLSKFSLSCVEKFNFDEKNILKLKELSKDKAEKLKPGYMGKICGTSGLFAFIIKDALEYCGAIEDKKTQASRIKANYLYQKTLFDAVNKYIAFLEEIYSKNKEKKK